MTKFELYKAAIGKVGEALMRRVEAILLDGDGNVVPAEQGMLIGFLEDALDEFMRGNKPANLELGRRLLQELRECEAPTAARFHAVGCAIVGPND